MAKITVIVPVYNLYEYIDRCLTSIVNQSFSDLEIVLINDGSTDKSAKKCQEWATRDDRIIFVSKKNEGAGPARNLGIQVASAEFIAFCDPDDWYDERYIEIMLNKQQETDADIVACGRYRYDGTQNKVVGTVIPLAKDVKTDYWSHWEWKLINALWVKIYRKSLFIDYGIKMPAGHGEDTAIQYFIMTVANKVAVVEQPLYYHWFNRAGSSLNSVKAHTSCTVMYLTYGWELFKRASMFERYKKPLLLECYSIIANWYPKIKDDEVYTKNWLSGCAKAIKTYFDDIHIKDSGESSKRIIGYGALGQSAAYWLPLLAGSPLSPTDLWDINGGTGEVSKPDWTSISGDDCILCFPRGDIENELRLQFEGLNCLVLYSLEIARWHAYWMIACILCKRTRNYE